MWCQFCHWKDVFWTVSILCNRSRSARFEHMRNNVNRDTGKFYVSCRSVLLYQNLKLLIRFLNSKVRKQSGEVFFIKHQHKVDSWKINAVCPLACQKEMAKGLRWIYWEPSLLKKKLHKGQQCPNSNFQSRLGYLPIAKRPTGNSSLAVDFSCFIVNVSLWFSDIFWTAILCVSPLQVLCKESL